MTGPPSEPNPDPNHSLISVTGFFHAKATCPIQERSSRCQGWGVPPHALQAACLLLRQHEVCLLIQVPFSAAPARPAMFVQLDVPAELHDLQLSLLSFALFSFGPGLQSVNKVLISDLLPVVLCSWTAIRLLQIELAFFLSPQIRSVETWSSI